MNHEDLVNLVLIAGQSQMNFNFDRPIESVQVVEIDEYDNPKYYVEHDEVYYFTAYTLPNEKRIGVIFNFGAKND